MKDEIELLINEFEILNLNEERIKPIHNRLMKGKTEIRTLENRYVLEFNERAKPIRDLIRVADIKLVELKRCKNFLYNVYKEYRHNEVKGLIKHTETLINDLKGDNEVNKYEVKQIKRLVLKNEVL